MSMRRYLWGQLRYRRTRTVALLVGILVATTSFTVLTGSATTSQLRTVGTVKTNARSAYDILVRPKGSTTGLERTRGLVRPNYLSGVFGGISVSQYQTVRRLPGVAVAAPIAMLGYVVPRVSIPLNLSVDLGDASRQLYRVSRSWVFDRGLSRAPDADAFVYVTDSQLQTPLVLGSEGVVTSEQLGTSTVPVCQSAGLQQASGPFDLGVRTFVACDSRAPRSSERPSAVTQWSFPLLIAAIDPTAEARLANVDQAVVSGRYLRPTDTLLQVDRGGGSALSIPVLSPTRPYDDEQLQLTVARLPTSAAQSLLRAPLAPSTAQNRFGQMAGVVVQRTLVTAADAYRLLLSQLGTPTTANSGLINAILTPGPVGYDTLQSGTLRPRTFGNPPSVWAATTYQNGFLPAPLPAADVQFRQLTPHPFREQTGRGATPVLRAVGEFDPAKLAGFSALSAVPLETYTPPQAAPGDAAARRVLAGRDLLPSSNVGGYLQPPPLMLTTLAVLPGLEGAYSGLHAAAPISVIRVRVAGVRGLDAVSRARVNAVTAAIVSRTGLDVDITAGSSPAPQTVQLAAGRFGRPPLTLREGWVKKGVAVAILTAVDRKSLVLFALILAVCALFVANASAAAVRARRTELGVLACIGWRPRKLFAAALLELGLVGLVAGVLGSLLALPLSAAVGLSVSIGRAALAVPAAAALALLAGVAPALRASRSDPGAAARPDVLLVHRARQPRGVASLALINLTRVPGRSLIGAASLAIGVCALTLLLAVTLAFQGQLAGSLLGSAISAQVRAVDYVAAVVMMALGALALADVLYLNVRVGVRPHVSVGVRPHVSVTRLWDHAMSSPPRSSSTVSRSPQWAHSPPSPTRRQGRLHSAHHCSPR